jgi:hypothetical protein
MVETSTDMDRKSQSALVKVRVDLVRVPLVKVRRHGFAARFGRSVDDNDRCKTS